MSRKLQRAALLLFLQHYKCLYMTLNCSILLDGYKKRSSLRQRSREKTEECKDHRLYRETPPGRDTVKGYKYRFLFIFLLTACFTSVLVCITNCTMCKLLFVSMCV